MTPTEVCIALLAAHAAAATVPSDPVDRYNVVWDSPSKDSSGSMPLGNGDVGLNVWVEPNGDLLFYISKTDAWSENGRLLKLGRVRVTLTPNPFAQAKPFRQTLRLRQGDVEIVAGDRDDAHRLTVWVDANRPVIHVEASSPKPFHARVALETWRAAPRTLTGDEVYSAYSMAGGPAPVVVTPDTVLENQPGRIVWFHRNLSSCWPTTMTLQGLESLTRTEKDPLLNRTFGAAITGSAMVRADAKTLRSADPTRHLAVSIHPLTRQTHTVEQWLAALDRQIATTAATDLESARREHRAWWHAFWNRSYIRLSGNPSGADLDMVCQRYALQRYVSACAGRGAYPIKFNGSIFTVDARLPKEHYDADYRRWGGCYWFQNTRLIYWPMLASGDFDMIRPLFHMYSASLPLAEARTRLYFHHDGAFIPETMTFWGTYANSNYGWDRTGKPISHCDNTYIRHYWSGQLELTAIMLDYYAFTEDPAFARTVLLPFATSALRFFDQHYRRDEEGKILFEPAQALETWHAAVNPLPEIAGLRFVLPRLIDLPAELTTDRQHADWRRMLGELPDLPTRQIDGKRILAAADRLIGEIRNSENPELYAVFPFRLFGVGKPDLQTARLTFAHRRVKGNHGWRQDDTQAALLGLTAQASDYVVTRFANKNPASRFPVFWGPNFDWIPDQDHGSNAILALQTMLMQTEGRKILLLPSWPKTWNVEFKLHAPMKTVVEGVYRTGKLERLDVTPQSRAADVVIVSAP